MDDQEVGLVFSVVMHVVLGAVLMGVSVPHRKGGCLGPVCILCSVLSVTCSCLL